jgi:hypothetical protein
MSLMSHLQKLGFDDNFFGENAFAHDDAAVMLGFKNGKSTLLKKVDRF